MDTNLTELCKRFLDEHAEKFLKCYYEFHITNAHKTFLYFKNYGGKNWMEKYHSSVDYKFYIECINSNLFKDELYQIKLYALKDMIEIIKNDIIDSGYICRDSDIYYSYEQFEFIYRNYLT